ncbi:hypothetical protein V8E36_008792 [Tilletia maclaganii]
MSSVQPTSGFGRGSKWTTHLSITGDIILGECHTTNYVHNIESSIYDLDDSLHTATCNVWARDAPQEGIVQDPATMRYIPAEFDGAAPQGLGGSTVGPMLSGIGVLTSTAADRKSGIISGFTYLNKTDGWQRFDITVAFESTVRWDSWMLPVQRQLVSFDALLSRRGEDDTWETLIRRMTAMGPATPILLQALGCSAERAGEKAARLKEIREAAGAKLARPAADKSTAQETTADPKQGMPDVNTAGNVIASLSTTLAKDGEDSSRSAPNGGQEASTSSAGTKAAVVPTKPTVITTVPPCTPTPPAHTRKRGRE